MTMKHVLNGLLQATGKRSDRQLRLMLDIDGAMFTRWRQGQNVGCHIRVFDRINVVTGVPFDRLFAWFRLPAEAVLDRNGEQLP